MSGVVCGFPGEEEYERCESLISDGNDLESGLRFAICREGCGSQGRGEQWFAGRGRIWGGSSVIWVK